MTVDHEPEVHALAGADLGERVLSVYARTDPRDPANTNHVPGWLIAARKHLRSPRRPRRATAIATRSWPCASSPTARSGVWRRLHRRSADAPSRCSSRGPAPSNDDALVSNAAQ